MISKQRVLITGGAGFIGAHLARRLAQGGVSVALLDDLSASASGALPRQCSRVIIGDVRDPRAVRLASEGCDLVLHLASVVGVDAVTADPERTGSVIRRGTRVVLDDSLRSERPLIFFSSSEVTDAPRRGPRAVYAEAKRDAEALLLDAADRLPITIIRPFNIVGPGQSVEQGMVLPSLAAAARAGRPLAVHGDGEQQRAFLHVDDLVDVMMELLQPARGVAPPGGEVLEIGGTGRVSIAHVAERLASLAGRGATVACGVPDGLREDRPRRSPDLSALRRRIAFAPRRSLDDILLDVLARA